MEGVNKASENLGVENLEKLRKVFPEFVKDGIIDFDTLKAFFEKEGKLPENQEKYGLNWAGKSNAFKLIQTPATGTLTPDEKASKDFEKTENIFIEGDNLEVLKLLQKHYREKIKMIYIDPPYNTGKDSIYKDNFTENKSDYYERTGQNAGGIPMTTNRDSSGRYHSDWLTMMYPRLFLARNLLKEDGVIFISIDDNEVANLRLIMDEIFGEENFEGHIHWRRRHNQPNDPTKLIGLVAEHIIVYAKSSQYLGSVGVGKLELTGSFSNPDNDPRGKWNSKPWRVGSNQNGSRYSITLPNGKVVDSEWMGEEKTYKKLLADGRIYFPKNGDIGLPRKKIFRFEREKAGQSATNWFEHQNSGNNQEASAEIARLFEGNKNIFDNPKPVKLLKKLIRLGNFSDNDIILDFFAGSGTTAHAVMDLNAGDGGNRKWICVQLPELTDENSEARKVGFKNIAQIARRRICRAAEEIIKDKDDKLLFERGENFEHAFEFKSFTLSKSNYREWNILGAEDDSAKLKEQLRLIKDKPLVNNFDEKSVVYEILLKEGFDLNSFVVSTPSTTLRADSVEKSPWTVSDSDRKMIVSFTNKLTQEQVDSFGLNEGDLFVCLDSALDDTTKVNILRRKFNVKTI
jgi:adenine-specific DNA-methyltransferase